MKRRAGFTLIELVVVIMILGILAGVAAPKFFGTSQTATDNSLRQTLAIVRDAIELYNAKYNALPSGTGAQVTTALTEFLRSPLPACTVGPNKNANISVVSVAGNILVDGTPTTGWKYNSQTGQFIINYGAVSNTPGVNYDTF